MTRRRWTCRLATVAWILLICTSESKVRRRHLANTIDLTNNTTMALDRQLQPLLYPKVTVVERFPTRRVFGSLSLPDGSPWCAGQPTYWLVGHQSQGERPSCWNRTHWLHNSPAVMEVSDIWNSVDSPHIDRHECVAMHVNNDDLLDIVCLVGADKATGKGYNEVYLTRPNGSLFKIGRHGLHRYPSMSTRHAAALQSATGHQLLFIATTGAKRRDGLPNQHRMFRKDLYQAYFREVKGPWIRHVPTECAVSADIDGDGIDDLILCTKKSATLYRQDRSGRWTVVKGVTGPHVSKWGGVQVEDVTGDGRVDLVVVGQIPYGQHRKRSFVKVFRGISRAPFFDFGRPYYERVLSEASPSVAVLDVNRDGRKDLYVVQTNRRTGYCADRHPFRYWGGGLDPPREWQPPLDTTRDLLLLGTAGAARYRVLNMPLRYQYGCGFLAQRFGDDQTMLLAYGDTMHNGFNLLVEW